MTCLLYVRRVCLVLYKKPHVRMLFTGSRVSCKDPFKIFNQWFIEARNACDPRDMIFTAILRDGSFFLQPLQCQSYSERGFKYYLLEKSNARKNDSAALTFIWPSKRMVRIEGNVNYLPQHEIDQFFFNRIPYDEQINLVCSTDTTVVESKTVLRDKVEAIKKKYEKGKVPVPSSFCGHMLTPSSIEFYENAGGTFQNRLKFVKSDEEDEANDRLMQKGENGWKYQILSP